MKALQLTFEFQPGFEMKIVFKARPHPDVDSLAPARSALRASGFAGLFSPFPKRLKSPPGEGIVRGHLSA
jgi:hypothetical protein